MSRLVSQAESWETTYTAFQNINFAAFDYDTVKQSILDYIKLYFPESFNDFIESSELIAIVETFAYISELIAYRVDVNAHENFISTAQRKESILRLAKFVSYKASRPLPARGLVKLTSVSTTESIVDINGLNLANRVIRWNDLSNVNWKNQFLLVMNRVLQQDFGTVLPADRFQIQDVLFELYSINMIPLNTGVFPYTASANGQTVTMELVPVAADDQYGIIERRPSNNSDFTLLYGQDGLGDASDTTGFFCYTKQGSLQKFTNVFDGVTPNQTYVVPATNVNDIDIWVNNVDPVTGITMDVANTLPYRPETLSGKSGEWNEVDLANAQNVIFNTNPLRNKYEIDTIANNQVRIVFGDGEFADIPSGTFDFWVRSSLDQDIVVPQTAVIDTRASFTYVDALGRTQTFTFTFSLISSLQNASASETIEHIRSNAPAVYYTQDRMVNGADYNSYMMKDSSILKLRAINRTFAGDSKYIPWHDASGTYENVKMFGDDGYLYYQTTTNQDSTPTVNVDTLIGTYIEPLLSSTDIFTRILVAGVPANQFRRNFTSAEKLSISDAIASSTLPSQIALYYNIVTYDWHAVTISTGPTSLSGWPTQFITDALITVVQPSSFSTSYVVSRNALVLTFQSPTTMFWNTNNASTVINYSTLNSNQDVINVLNANLNYNKTGILKQTWQFYVLSQESIVAGPDAGLPDVTRVSILPVDTSKTGVPPGLNVDDPTGTGLADIISPKYYLDISNITIPPAGGVVLPTLPIMYVVGAGDVTIVAGDTQHAGATAPQWSEDASGALISNRITLYSKGTSDGVTPNTTLYVKINEYVYFTRPSVADDWSPAPTTPDNMNAYVVDKQTASNLWTRYIGTSNLNFSWFHNSPRYYLVDPSPSNINDVFIITKGYYLSLKNWLEDQTAPRPVEPTPLDLRTAYNYLTGNAMISDEVVLQPGKFKLLFGSKADSTLQATFLVIRSSQQQLTDNQIKTAVVTAIRNFFDITLWEFGETFYFTELAAAIHTALPSDISSVVLVPKLTQNYFGTMFQVIVGENEIVYPDINVEDIEIVSSYTSTNLRQV